MSPQLRRVQLRSFLAAVAARLAHTSRMVAITARGPEPEEAARYVIELARVISREDAPRLRALLRSK